MIDSTANTRLTLAVSAARHIADLTGQMHIDALWQAKSDTRETQWLLQRLRDEHDAAHLALLNTLDDSWWDDATVEDIARTYEQGRIWGRGDPDIQRLELHMLTVLSQRFAVDIHDH